jgi:amidase
MSSLVRPWSTISTPNLPSSDNPFSQDRTPSIFRLPKLKGLDLFEITIHELQEHFKNGSLTVVEYVSFCLERIQKIDPCLEAVLETNPDALLIAASLDKERQNGKN